MPKHAWSTAIEPRAQALIGKLFERIEGAIGNKAAALYEGATPEVVQAEWAEALAGFSDVEVMRGLAEVRKRPFAPNAGEFARMCRPALDPEYAWHEAGECLRQRDALGADGKPQAGDWSHPAVFRAANRMAQEVRGGDYRANRVRWGFILAREFAAGWGDPVEPPTLKVEHKPSLGPPPAAVREQMALILNAPKVAAALRKRQPEQHDPALVARCERIASINWIASTPQQRASELGEAFRHVRVVEAVPGVPPTITVDLNGRRAMLCGADLESALAETIAARAAASQSN